MTTGNWAADVGSVHWGNGWVEFGGDGAVKYFELDDVVWYDCDKGIALPGWEAALEPYEGPGHIGRKFTTEVPDRP